MTLLSAQARFKSVRDISPTFTAGSIVFVALVLAMIARWPYFAVGRADDGFFSEVALMWRQGSLPYLTVFDVKPPGLFAVLAVAQMMFGPGLIALRVVGTLSDATTIGLLLYFAARRGAPGAGLFAALLFAWFSHAALNDDCYSLLLALTTLAMTLGTSGLEPVRRAFWSGLAIGAAGLVKQTAAFEGLALFVILTLNASIGRSRWRIAAVYLIGAALLPLVCISYFALNGGLFALLTDTIGVALHRPSAESDNLSFLGGIFRFGQFAGGVAPIFVIAVATASLVRSLPRFRPEVGALGLWLGASFIGVIVQRALLGTYLSPLLPPAFLLAGFGLAIRLEKMPLATMSGLGVLAACVMPGSVIAARIVPPADMTGIDRVAAAIATVSPERDDTVYVIGASPRAMWVYPRTGLRPATSFLIPNQQACHFPNVGPGRIDEAFAARPGFVVTDAEQKGYLCEIEDIYEKVQSTLRRDYRLMTRADGLDESYNVYEGLR
jgi:hypothetical protein